jgi:hypothetical protein
MDRCKEQNINEETIKQVVKTLPVPKGRFRWRSSSGVQIVYAESENRRTVITVIGNEKQWYRFKRYARNVERRLNRRGKSE